MKFEAEGREFAKFMRSLEQFIQTVKDQKPFLNAVVFCSQKLGKQVTHTLKGFLLVICIYIFSGALRLITGGGLPLETSDFLENSNFEAIDISSMINEQYQGFSSNMINITSDCDLIPPFPNRMWGAVSTLGLVSTFSDSMVFLTLWC